MANKLKIKIGLPDLCIVKATHKTVNSYDTGALLENDFNRKKSFRDNVPWFVHILDVTH